jgi:L-amino acid N-acyltransferase YncA
MLIRKATKEDANGIAKVHVESWRETYAGIISQDYLDSLKAEVRLPLWKKSLSETLDTSPVFVAVNDENKVVGFASFGKERTGKFKADGELYAIYILKEYQRGKLGLKLLQAGINVLLEQKYSSMLVWVLAENGSRRFYESLQPVKAGKEIVKIGGQDHQEVAFVWEDLNSLNEIVIKKLNMA